MSVVRTDRGRPYAGQASLGRNGVQANGRRSRRKCGRTDVNAYPPRAHSANGNSRGIDLDGKQTSALRRGDIRRVCLSNTRPTADAIGPALRGRRASTLESRTRASSRRFDPPARGRWTWSCSHRGLSRTMGVSEIGLKWFDTGSRAPGSLRTRG